ncbi:hypothetical protein [Deinococcus ficus]|uniref:DUF302 domain-containing protein n=1 Tax=Deinococcus ficus TaxID=317577 RepID=A0A221T314_9DEIO|nr:hypothetical protein [Deinococcus ficus]ASN83292.1 hypothetical protein DFI_19025 [Deinococcus ficus]
MKTTHAILTALALSAAVQAQNLPASQLQGIPPGVPRRADGSPDTSKFVKGPDGLYYSPNMTPAQRAQMAAIMQEQAAAAKPYSTSMIEAVNVVMNEPKKVSVLAFGLPRELITALGRAALHVPVNMLSINVSYDIPRVNQAAVRGNPGDQQQITLIATSQHYITYDRRGVKVYKLPQPTSALHDHIALMRSKLTGGR